MLLFTPNGKAMNNYLKNRLDSFKYAFRGIRTLFAETRNAQIHLVFAVLAVVLGFVFRISEEEWLAVCIVIGLVLAMEALNTSLETLADYACKKEIHPLIKKAKDVAAAGVLLAAMTALAVGVIVFFPKIVRYCTF